MLVEDIQCRNNTKLEDKNAVTDLIRERSRLDVES